MLMEPQSEFPILLVLLICFDEVLLEPIETCVVYKHVNMEYDNGYSLRYFCYNQDIYVIP